MDTTTPKKFASEQIFLAVYDACTVMVENMPKTQEYFQARAKLLAKIDNKVPLTVSNDISDLYIDLATHFGYEMFLLGISLGRDPSVIFDLSDGNDMAGDA